MTHPVEAAVIRATIRGLERHRGPNGERVVHFNIGASNGETGLPDRHACYRGRAIYIECKRPKGGVLGPKQAWWLQRLGDAGGVCLVVTRAEQVREVLERIDAECAAQDVRAEAVASKDAPPRCGPQPGARQPIDGGSDARSQ
jgi:hypothetical protein